MHSRVEVRKPTTGRATFKLVSLPRRYAAENAALFREIKGKKLLSCLVGDSLLEVSGT